MATIKSYTSVGQGTVLAEILPLESADMRYHTISKYNFYICDEIVYTINFGKPSGDDIPCWSLTALFGTLAENKICHYDDRYYCQYMSKGDEFPIYSTAEYDNPVDACYEMILKLYELKLL